MVLEKRVQLKELIFSKIDPYDVYQMYVPGVGIKKKMRSPIRTDKHEGSWGVFYVDNEPLWKDFATGESGNCIKLVQEMFGVSYGKALEKIARDFLIIEGTDNYKKIIANYQKPIIPATQSTLIQLRTKKFTAKDLQYWLQYGITPQELKENNIYSIKEDECYINRQKWSINKGELAFGYYYEHIQKWKLLFPEKAKEDKWRNNLPLATVIGLENLNKDSNTIVAKSLKDYIVTRKIHPNCCYCQNESLQAIPKEKADIITSNSKKVYYSGDCDQPGKAASYKITEAYCWAHLNPPDRIMPLGKDMADWAMLEGIEPIREHLVKKKII